MSDKMRFGSISSPQRWTVRESIAFLETNALDDFNDVDNDAARTRMMSGSDSVDDVKNSATAEEDADDEEENEPTLPMMTFNDQKLSLHWMWATGALVLCSWQSCR